MNPLAAAALAAGELICEFNDGYKKSLLAGISGDAPRVELILVYEAIAPQSAEVLSTRKPGRHAVEVRSTDRNVYFIQRDGPSVRVTTLTGCLRERPRDGTCTRFDARHAWTFDTSMHLDPDAALARQPSGSASGACEPWKIED
jgi:hypothetical protein